MMTTHVNLQTSGVSVVFGSYNRRPFIETAFRSIRENGISVPYEIIVVDGGSTDGSLEYLARQKDVITIVQHNRGTWRGKPIPQHSWGYFMNLGFKCSQGKFICMISDDSLLVPGSVMAGIELYNGEFRAGRKIGAVAFYWRNWPDQSKYWVGLTLGDKLFVNHGLFLRQALAEVGWLDEETYRFYHADGDVCLKMWTSGYEVIECPNSYVEHFSHLSTWASKQNVARQQEDWQAYQQRWKGILSDGSELSLGGWRQLDYNDPFKTVALFPRREVLRYRFIKQLNRVWTHIRNVNKG